MSQKTTKTLLPIVQVGLRRVWQVSLSEAAPVGTPVPGLTDLRACDDDTPPNNRIFYYITCECQQVHVGHGPRRPSDPWNLEIF